MCLQRIKRNLYWKMKFLRQAAYIRYVIAKLSKCVQAAHWPPQIPFYRRLSEYWKAPGTSFQATFFIEFFDKKFCFVILHKLDKVHYQTVFTSVFTFRVSCLGIWWRHDIWILEKLKFDYLKNEKSFRREIKKFFLVSQMLSFRHTKQASKM